MLYIPFLYIYNIEVATKAASETVAEVAENTEMIAKYFQRKKCCFFNVKLNTGKNERLIRLYI